MSSDLRACFQVVSSGCCWSWCTVGFYHTIVHLHTDHEDCVWTSIVSCCSMHQQLNQFNVCSDLRLNNENIRLVWIVPHLDSFLFVFIFTWGREERIQKHCCSCCLCSGPCTWQPDAGAFYPACLRRIPDTQDESLCPAPSKSPLSFLSGAI